MMSLGECQGWPQAGSQREEHRRAREWTGVKGPGDHDRTLTGATIQDGLSQVTACLGGGIPWELRRKGI